MHSGNPDCCEASALLAAISRAQEHFIREDDPKVLFDELLKDFLALTDSACGFIGEILHTAEGSPYLKTHAITNVAWNDETREFYEKNAPKGLEFFNLRTLFGAVIETGEPVITNAPADDSRRAGTPVGHPRLDAFLGVPVHSGDSLVGMIGVANRPGGYDESQIEFLQPLLRTYGQLIYSYSIRRQRKLAEEELRKSRDELEIRVRERIADLEEMRSGLLQEIEQRRQSEDALRQSKESLANAQRIARLGNWDWDIVRNTLSWSDEIYRVFGVEPQQFAATYEAFLASVHPDDRELVSRSVDEALRDCKPYDIHHRISLPDGKEKIVLEQAEVTRDEGGRPLRMSGTVQDVTERKMAEESLKASEARFRTLVEQSPFVIQIYSPDGRLQMVNRAFENLWGLNMESLAGYNIFDDQQLIDKGIMPYIEMGFAGKAAEIPAVAYDPAINPVYKGPPSSKWVRTFIYTVRGEAGRVREVILIQEDVTERKKAEEQLRQAAAVLENTAEAVVITDPEANIIDVNRVFTEIIGYTKEEVLGQNPRLLKSLRHEKSFYEAMWDSLNKAGYWRGEIWNRRKNGEIFPVWSTISAIHDDAGRLTHYVSLFSDISSLKRSEEQLYYLAHHDPLTDLPNRMLFNDRLEHAMVRARREKYRLALLFLDLDRFKNINDGFGHPTGDKLLQEAARRIVRQVREEDTVARLGGDEFVVLMEGIAESGDAAILATKLVDTFSRSFSIDDRELHVTVSIGISIFPEDGNDATLLIRNADAAMYRAKEEGRNDFQFYTRELTSRAFEKVLLETSLRRALEREEFCLYYQPQFSLATGEITGAEALLRWKHPAMGLLLPAKFIQLAEETGIIFPIGEWALRAACAQMRQWQLEGFPLKLISVNISQTHFQRGDLGETVTGALNETGLDPCNLELEITESILTNSPERAIAALSRLRKMGVSVALDDFGTGYSSLSHLKNLPLNKLKIDQSFVRNLPLSPNDKGIVMAIISLGWIMGLNVTAEGVETDEQRTFLRNQGCKEYQGYLGGHPMPAEEFTRFLSKICEENRGKLPLREG